MPKKSFNFFIEFFAFIAGIIIFALTIAISLTSFARYLGIRSPLWMFQFTEYSIVWFTFLAAAWLLREGGHINIDTFFTRLPHKTRNSVEIINNLLGFIVSFIIFLFGSIHTIDLIERGIMEVKGVTIPKFPIFLIIPIGGLTLSIQFGRQFIGKIKSKINNRKDRKEDFSKIFM